MRKPVPAMIAGMCFAALVSTGLEGTPPASQSPADSRPAIYRQTLDRYCIPCHNEKLKTAGMIIDKIDLAHVAESAPVWEKVVRKLRGRQMPPAGRPRPDNATYDAIASYLEAELDHAAAINPMPGRPTLHRLNRAEYANAVRDLL